MIDYNNYSTRVDFSYIHICIFQNMTYKSIIINSFDGNDEFP